LDGLNDEDLLSLSTPSAEGRPRYGYGRPQHARIRTYLDRFRHAYSADLEAIKTYQEELLRIPLRPTAPGQPCWINGWLLGLDTASLYTTVRSIAPARYFEVGSGWSTLTVAQARADGSLPTQIVSIDPKPRTDVDEACNRVIRVPFELAAGELIETVAPGDVIFFDCSHRVFSGSDVTVFYLEVMPELPDGVVVGVHDILWPEDYPPEWRNRWYSEQYILGAYMIAEAPWIRPRLACNYASSDPELARILAPFWALLPGVDPRGFTFWFESRRK